MTRDQLIDRIKRCSALPSLPTVAVKVLELARSDEVEISEIASLISNDPALSGKVLRTVNSPFYGLTKTVTTISHALIILGTETVKTLVLGFTLVRSLHNDNAHGQTQMAYWRRSLYSAVAARLLSQRLGMVEREEMFMAGLLQDLGVQILKQVIPAEYDALLSSQSVWDRRLARAERAALGMTHHEVGVMMAEQWHLPPKLQAVIQYHDLPREGGEAFQMPCMLVRLANLCAEVFMERHDARYVARVRKLAWKAFQLESGQCDQLLAEISQGTRELADLLNISIGEHRNYEEILLEASETLQDLTIKTQFNARQMKAAAETDPLTGVANRRKLESQIEDEFRRSIAFNRPLSLLFLDMDHFKRINDTYGHAAGDEALKHVGRVLTSMTRAVDTVARYGGEEFVVLLPEATLAVAARRGEEVRKAIEQAAVPHLSIKLTVSVGVASFDGTPGAYKVAAHLVQAADRAAYAAKSAGRNTVRIFAPRAKPVPATA